MIAHKSIRERQAVQRDAYNSGSITTAEYVANMNALKVELDAAEREMYADHATQQLIMLKWAGDTIMLAYRKISTRFPHLDLESIISFEKKARAAGGKLMIHSGRYLSTLRTHQLDAYTDIYCENPREKWGKGDGLLNVHDASNILASWTCCHHYVVLGKPRETVKRMMRVNMQAERHLDATRDSNGKWRSTFPATKMIIGDQCEEDSPDLYNPDPCGRCDHPVEFALHDEKEQRATDFGHAIDARIAATERECTDIHTKLARLKELKAVLGPLADP
jgi:hypothetical protein